MNKNIMPNGIPSHDTFGNVLAALDLMEFEKRFQQWFGAIGIGTLSGKQIALDGKALRRGFDKASGKAMVYMVNAYVVENHAVFCQVKVPV